MRYGRHSASGRRPRAWLPSIQWICSPTRLDDRTATCLSELPTDLPYQMTIITTENQTEGAYALIQQSLRISPATSRAGRRVAVTGIGVVATCGTGRDGYGQGLLGAPRRKQSLPSQASVFLVTCTCRRWTPSASCGRRRPRPPTARQERAGLERRQTHH
jgi:hypothetical protein